MEHTHQTIENLPWDRNNPRNQIKVEKCHALIDLSRRIEEFRKRPSDQITHEEILNFLNELKSLQLEGDNNQSSAAHAMTKMLEEMSLNK